MSELQRAIKRVEIERKAKEKAKQDYEELKKIVLERDGIDLNEAEEFYNSIGEPED